jgi:hypothetical protein
MQIFYGKKICMDGVLLPKMFACMVFYGKKAYLNVVS